VPALAQGDHGQGDFLDRRRRRVLGVVEKKNDAQIQARVAGLRTQFQNAIADADQRKEFVYLLDAL